MHGFDIFDPPGPEKQIRGSIVVSISACHAEDPGSIPGRGVVELVMWEATGKIPGCC